MNRKYRNLTFVIILFFVAGSLAAALFALRQNNLRMRELREAVFIADREGSEEELDTALIKLQQHVVRHMNTDLTPGDDGGSEKPIQLSYKYYRDTIELWQEEAREAGVSIQPLRAAQAVCETDEYVIAERLNCLIEQTRETPGFPQPQLIDKTFYVYDFVSPDWSPDLAGYSLVFFAGSLGALVLRLLF